MLIREVHIENAAETSCIRIEDGRFTAIEPKLEPRDDEEVIEGKGRLALPPFVEPHIHLDACLTAGRPRWNESGTLFEGIQIFGELKPYLTPDDVYERSTRALRMMAAHGIQYVRSHVDVSDPHLTALEPLLAVKHDLSDLIDVQLVAFPQEGVLSFPHGEELLVKAVEAGVDAVGGCPHIEHSRDLGVKSLEIIFDIASAYGLMVDVHCDEIDDPSSRNLEVLCAQAIARDMGSLVTASHVTAMGSYPDAYAARLISVVARSGISVVSNPMVNMHLGGRFDTYPKRRGLTRVRELDAARVNVCFGEDDLRDPWHPMGNADMLDAVWMGVYATHMMGYQDLLDSYRFVTTNAARALCVHDGYGIKVSNPASLVIVDAADFYQALYSHAPVIQSIRQGRLVAQTRPAQTELLV